MLKRKVYHALCDLTRKGYSTERRNSVWLNRPFGPISVHCWRYFYEDAGGVSVVLFGKRVLKIYWNWPEYAEIGGELYKVRWF